jgi:hypothetical protein
MKKKSKSPLFSFLESVEVDRIDNPPSHKQNHAEKFKEACFGKNEDKTEIEESSFSRKHYQAIANILKDAKEQEDNPAAYRVIDMVGEKLSELFIQDNPSFNKELFLKASNI